MLPSVFGSVGARGDTFMNKQTHLSDDFIDSGIVSREQWPYGSPYASCIRPYASCYDPVIALVEEGEDHDNGDMYNGNTIVNETEQRFSTGSKILVSLGFQRLRLVFSF